MKNLLSMLLVFSFLFTIGCEDAEEGTVTDILSYTLSGNNMTMSLTDEGLTITYIWEKE